MPATFKTIGRSLYGHAAGKRHQPGIRFLPAVVIATFVLGLVSFSAATMGAMGTITMGTTMGTPSGGTAGGTLGGGMSGGTMGGPTGGTAGGTIGTMGSGTNGSVMSGAMGGIGTMGGPMGGTIGTMGMTSDIRAKHDIVLLGYLDNGLGFYRFSYNGVIGPMSE